MRHAGGVDGHHKFFFARNRSDGVAVAERFGIGDQVRADLEILLCAALRNAEAGLTSSMIITIPYRHISGESWAAFRGRVECLLHCPSSARRRWRQSRPRRLDGAFEHLNIIEGQRDNIICNPFGDAGCVGAAIGARGEPIIFGI